MAKKKGGKPSDSKRPSSEPETPKASSEATEPSEGEALASSKDVAEATSTASEAEGSAEAARAPAEPSSPVAEATDSKATPAASPKGAAWGEPIARFERGLTWFETRLLVFVLLSLIAAMVAWVSLKGLSSPLESQSRAGTVFRGIVGAIALGVPTWWATGRAGLGQAARSVASIVAVFAGFALAPLWRATGVAYFGQVLNWAQEGSTLTMFGGLRGVSTRLTVLLALLGGSLAAANGKHINIDVALRFVPSRFHKPVFVIQHLATVVVCVVAAWGFFDYVSIFNFGAKSEQTRSEKIAVVSKAVSQDLFLLRKQLRLDLSASAHVLGGDKWDADGRMNGREWNRILDEDGYADYFSKEQVDALRAGPDELDAPRLAQAVGPEGPPRNLLVRTMNLTFAVGLMFIALRFLLRVLLVLSGHHGVESDPDYDPDQDPKRHKEREKVEDEALHSAGDASAKEVG